MDQQVQKGAPEAAGALSLAEQEFKTGLELGLKEPRKALGHFLKAYELEHPLAPVTLFSIYTGRVSAEQFAPDVIEHDEARALEYLQAGVKAGEPTALRFWANVLGNGEYGVEVNHKEAVINLRLAAMGGDAIAQHMMGTFHLQGVFGLEYDAQKALHYLKQAAEKAFGPALFEMGSLYRDGIGVDRDMRMAFSYYLEAAKRGNLRGLTYAADILFGGIGVEAQPETAVKMYEEAAKEDDAYALVRLARAYGVGRGVEKDEAKAEEYLQKAMDLGDAEAFTVAGVLAFEKEDFETALSHYSKAAEQQFVRAYELLADLYSFEKAPMHDVAKSVEYLEKAASAGSAPAAGRLFYLYDQGVHVEKDEARAREYGMMAILAGEKGVAADYFGRFPDVYEQLQQATKGAAK
jgi:TPR repeat protein